MVWGLVYVVEAYRALNGLCVQSEVRRVHVDCMVGMERRVYFWDTSEMKSLRGGGGRSTRGFGYCDG